MNNQSQPEIFFHVGMGKVASKYLQFVVFPKVKGIHYIPTGKYKSSKDIIKRGKNNKYLVSREFDRQMEDEAKWFSADFPQARTIILLRRHDSWIASQYRRFVKNGFPGSFTDFIDIDENKGKWDKKELLFFEKIKILEKHFQNKPLVMFYDDLRKDPKVFISQLLSYMKATVDFDKVSFSSKHSSYNEKQLKVMQWVRKNLPFIEKDMEPGAPLRAIRLFIKRPFRYTILYLGQLMPMTLLPKEDLIPKAELEKIKQKYTSDWDACLEYAKINNPN